MEALAALAKADAHGVGGEANAEPFSLELDDEEVMRNAWANVLAGECCEPSGVPAEASLRNLANHDRVLDYWAKGFMARVNAFFSYADGPSLEARCMSLAYNHDDDQTQWVL